MKLDILPLSIIVHNVWSLVLWYVYLMNEHHIDVTTLNLANTLCAEYVFLCFYIKRHFEIYAFINICYSNTLYKKEDCLMAISNLIFKCLKKKNRFRTFETPSFFVHGFVYTSVRVIILYDGPNRPGKSYFEEFQNDKPLMCIIDFLTI